MDDDNERSVAARRLIAVLVWCLTVMGIISGCILVCSRVAVLQLGLRRVSLTLITHPLVRDQKMTFAQNQPVDSLLPILSQNPLRRPDRN